MKFLFHPEASVEIQDTFKWYEEHQSGLGFKFVKELENTIARILIFPNHGNLLLGEIRRAIVPTFPYGIVYTTQNKSMEVYAVAHLHRKPFYWKKRIQP
jgi:hypothetical protein